MGELGILGNACQYQHENMICTRCMAGTLLLHVGIDLFLEGVYDSVARLVGAQLKPSEE